MALTAIAVTTRIMNQDTQYRSWDQSMLMSPASSNAIRHDLLDNLHVHWSQPKCIPLYDSSKIQWEQVPHVCKSIPVWMYFKGVEHG